MRLKARWLGFEAALSMAAALSMTAAAQVGKASATQQPENVGLRLAMQLGTSGR